MANCDLFGFSSDRFIKLVYETVLRRLFDIRFVTSSVYALTTYLTMYHCPYLESMLLVYDQTSVQADLRALDLYCLRDL